jgi:formylglycine-generating enzyme required for sulfatase activity
MALLVVTSAACSSSGPSREPGHTLAAALTAGQVRTDPKVVEQVWVPAGSFMMGTDDASIEQLTAQDPRSLDLSVGRRLRWESVQCR